jgi:two-component system OmpR family response regulator
MKILLIEDDCETATYISDGLSEAGHTIVAIGDGLAGFQTAIAENWDLMIVDRMLPKLDGLTLVRKLRDDGIEGPILFLTALGGIDDRVCGLETGGDDYLLKPFAFVELLARINALGRRQRTQKETIISVMDLKLDLISRKVRRADRTIELLPQEFRLLEYLMRNAGRVVTRTMMLENVWDLYFDPGTNIVESHISHLRSKLNDTGKPRLISTIRGIGYVLNVA